MVKHQSNKATVFARIFIYGILTVLLTMGLGPMGIVCGVMAFWWASVDTKKAKK